MIEIMLIFILIMSIFNIIKKEIFPFLFNILWLIAIILSKLNIYKFNKIDNYTYFLAIIGIISVNFGFYLSNYILVKKKIGKLNLKKLEFIKIVNLLFLILNLILFYRVIILLKDFPYAAIRVYQFPTKGVPELLYLNKYIRIGYHFLAKVIVNISFFIFIYLYFYNIQKKKIQILIILNILLYTFITAGRLVLCNFIVITILYYIYNIKKIKKKLPLKRILLLIIIISAMTIFRSWKKSNTTTLYGTLIVYYTGSINMFDYYLNNLQEYKFYLGRLNFSILDSPISIILKKVLKLDIRSAFEEYNNLNSIYLNIGNQKYNALYTIFQSFYADFKEIGVIVYSIIYGTLILVFFKKYRENIYLCIIMVYIQVLFLQSILKNNLLDYPFYLTIFFSFYFGKEKN